jgi:hypothetical protein
MRPSASVGHQTSRKELNDVAVAPDGSVYAVGSKRVSITVATPGWPCGLAETPTDVAAGRGSVVVTGFHHGCAGT